MDNGTEDVRRLEGNQIPADAGLVLLIPIPSRTLGQSLARHVCVDGAGVLALGLDFLDGSLVPVSLSEDLRLAETRCLDGGTRGKNDNTLDAGAGLQCALQDTGGTSDGGVDKLLGVGNIEVEGGSGVLDGINTLDSLVEGIILNESEYSISI